MKRLQLIALAMIAGSISCTPGLEASRSLSTLHLKIINTGTNPTGVLTVDFPRPDLLPGTRSMRFIRPARTANKPFS